MKRIGLLGGSFDPLHFGHLNMAIMLQEAHRLDEVLFCPAYTSPFKTAAPPAASAEHRLAMVSRGIKDIASFSLLDWEVAQTGPSYTIHTVKQLQHELGPAEIFLLLGEDQLQQLHHWKNFEELFSLCRPLVASREKKQVTLSHLPEALQTLLAEGRTEIPLLDISSTLIKERLKYNLFCGHLTSALILDYIHHHRIYS